MQIDLSNPDDLTEYLDTKFRKWGAAGMSVTLLRGGEVVYSEGFGYADIASGRGINADTLFQVASLSKTVTGTAVMQLYDRGLLDLDEDISIYLPFAVSVPGFEQKPITARMLLAHTSSIRDNMDVIKPTYTIETGGGDSEISLDEFLRSYLLADGENYNTKKNFYQREPNTRSEYCNVGYALLGYLVETISGQDFSEYCEENIFAPLQMNDTGWRLDEVDTSRMATPYVFKKGAAVRLRQLHKNQSRPKMQRSASY
jgi:CubicO group peptidase (beta-lactamase class C family)